MQNYQFLKVKNSLLELENDFIGLQDREFKDRKEIMKGEIEDLFHNQIIVSKDDMDRIEEQEMNNKTKKQDQL